MSFERAILGDTWYAAELGESCRPVREEIRRRCPGWLEALASRVGAVHGLLTFWIGRRFALIVTAPSAPGALTLLWIEALSRPPRPRIVLLELMWPERARGSGWRRHAYPVYLRTIVAPPLRRVMALGHVLTSWEPERYAGVFEVPVDRFRYVAFPLSFSGSDFPLNHERTTPSSTSETRVVSSGRTACDWDTLFQAAEGRSWPLTVICSRRDLPHVRRLNLDGRARVLSEISPEEHQRHLGAASVYALCLKETGMSSGHVRLGNVVQAGAPIVATKTKGLEGYVVDGETALLVGAGDAIALREAIELLLGDADQRERLRRGALAHSARSSFDDYMGKIRRLVDEAAVEASSSAEP